MTRRAALRGTACAVPVHGVLLLDKPLGLSSNEALQQAKRLYRAEKAGHTGTLDPLATGLLPLCFGAATKFAQVSLDADKRYLATLKLGQTTTTGDAEGEVVASAPVAVIAQPTSRPRCARFVGAIRQVPPMHSALKHDGKPLYDYARAGIEIEREPRSVTIHAIDVVGRGGRPLDDRRRLQQGHLHPHPGRGHRRGARLRRAPGGAAPHRQRRAWASTPRAPIEALEALSPKPSCDAALLPADALIADWPKVVLDAEDAGRFLAGVRRRAAAAPMRRTCASTARSRAPSSAAPMSPAAN